jgi:hypothetical protein
MKICFAIPIFVILSLKICELSAAIVNEQFDVYPSYLGFEYENDSSDSILSEQFNVLPSYFTYDSDGDISTSIYNGKINLLTNGLPPSYENKLFISYSINQEDANGILYFTVEAGNSVTVTDGGTWINEDGDIDPMNLAEVGISFDNFGGDGLITLENANGTKRIRYSNSLFGDGYLNVDNFDKVYLRLSYDFDTSYYKTYYSIDGINFTELSEIDGPQASTFNVGLEAESRNVSFNQGEVYFDNFVISNSPSHNPTPGIENNLEVNASNGVLNVTSENGEGEKGIEILYSVDSSNTNTGILYATVLANNSKDISDGGSLIDNEGGTELYYEVGCGLGFSNFSGDGWIELKNRNGSKKIEYYGGELDVSSLDDIYLRVSYEFGTNTAKSYYSMDGQNFTELGSEYAPNDNFFVSLEVETRNVSLEDGDVYFDNFVISDDNNYEIDFYDPNIIIPISSYETEFSIINGPLETIIHDANGNGVVDFEEIFDQNYNGIKDDNEGYYDENGNGIWDSDTFDDKNGNGVFDGQIKYITLEGLDRHHKQYGFAPGIYIIKNVPEEYPIRLQDKNLVSSDGLEISNSSQIEYSGEFKTSDSDSNHYGNYYYGDVVLFFKKHIRENLSASIYVKDKGYLGSENMILIDESYSINIDPSIDRSNPLWHEQLVETFVDIIRINNSSTDNNDGLSISEIQDLRPGSTMIEVSGNQATVQLQMEESSDLQTWEDTGTPATMTIPADTDTKFFRFKMAE